MEQPEISWPAPKGSQRLSEQEHPPNLQFDPGQRTKRPQTTFDFFAVPPNRDTLGDTTDDLIVENNADILVDYPAWN